MLQLKATYYLFHDGGSYHIETSPLNCIANQWTGFYMVGTSVMKKLNGHTIKSIIERKICQRPLLRKPSWKQ